jgi:hypothetical protein
MLSPILHPASTIKRQWRNTYREWRKRGTAFLQLFYSIGVNFRLLHEISRV